MSRPWVMPLDAREVVAVDVDVWEALEAERDALRARVAELEAALRWLAREMLECPLAMDLKDHEGRDVCFVDETGDDCPPGGDEEICWMRAALLMNAEHEALTGEGADGDE